jgi:hypothetical protein
MPGDIEDEEFSEARDEAMEGLEDEENRSGQQGGSGQSKTLQEGSQKVKVGQHGLLDGDLATLKRKFPWLVDFSDSFIRAVSLGFFYRRGREQRLSQPLWPSSS